MNYKLNTSKDTDPFFNFNSPEKPETIDNYCYIDIEVNSQDKIYRLGLDYQDINLDIFATDFDKFEKLIPQLQENKLSICGHNYRRFDNKYLQKKYIQLNSFLNIDTLELSILAFPLEPCHKLNKEYKENRHSSNNPLEDAKETKALLRKILAALSEKPKKLQQTYRWLLTCGTTLADRAYRQFFTLLEEDYLENYPFLEEIPSEALRGFEASYIKQFFADSSNYDFDSRLSLAGLLAWNYERNVTQSPNCYPRWLSYLPGFYQILEGVRPLFAEGISYHEYLSDFGINQFRSVQEEAIQAISNHQNPLILMPTGGGKSLCYQLVAKMLFERQKLLTVVISPLQALMEDQVVDLQNQGLNFATFINGNLSSTERRDRLNKLLDGTLGLLYISPEQLRSMSIRALLDKSPPALWVIDEAHCLSKWGHDFRPDYRYIPKFIEELYQQRETPLPLPRLALMTATATIAVKDDIKQLFKSFGQKIKQEVIDSQPRANLTYKVIYCLDETQKEQYIVQEITKYLAAPGCVLVYTTTRKNAEKLALLLNQLNIEARYYHSKISKSDKQEILEAFKAGDLNVITATCAFGMGINRKDVRAVIHHTMSSNLENYIQESGRAGRDGEKALCSLLFDPKDADTIFFLQSLNHVSKNDSENIFIATRSLRDKLNKSSKVTEDWFWLTPNEIYQNSSLTQEFATQEDQLNTKIKVALYQLETYGLVERAENYSSFIYFDLKYPTIQQSLLKLEQFSQQQKFSTDEVETLKRLIEAMHILKSYYHQAGESIPLDRLTDMSGIPIRLLVNKMRDLEKADIGTFQIPLLLILNKGVVGDAKKNHQRLRDTEEKLLLTILELKKDQDDIQINLRGLASRLDPDGTQKIRAITLKNLLESWAEQQGVELVCLGRDLVRIGKFQIQEKLEAYKQLTGKILDICYEKLGNQNGGKLAIEFDINQLTKDIQATMPQIQHLESELEKALFWLHSQKLLRIAEGLNLFHEAFKIKVIKGGRITSINSGYIKQVKPYYEEQIKRSHVMLTYGMIDDSATRDKLVRDYFGLANVDFDKLYSSLGSSEAKLPIIKEDLDRIIDCLNETQKKIVYSESSALAVIAGPGSGKTRTIVHRIAYLVKVKRVDPNRILVLAYNRNAIKELRIRLQHLIGKLASPIRVYTFHGLALNLLGRTIGELKRNRQNDKTAWEKLLQEACELMEKGDELDEDDRLARRIQILGNLEYIFVDEYQDVGPQEYRLIQLLAGLGESEDETKKVQINLCVIGDDDQNIYEFKGSSPKYITQFEEEYQAEQFLLVENYRSTENIIGAANRLIQNNRGRCKQSLEQQVKINQRRQGFKGAPITSLKFSNTSQQAAWLKEQILAWLNSGIAPNEIAIIARNWDELSAVRLLLEQESISCYALKKEGISLVKNYATHLLINALKKDSTVVISPEESVQKRIENFFIRNYGDLSQPTVQTLVKIGANLDQERGYNSELALPISVDEVLTAIFEFNESGDTFLESNSILFTSCHGAKGLEFSHVVLLSKGFDLNYQDIESERRLFYVAITRAKQELLLSSTTSCPFITEAGINSENKVFSDVNLPKLMHYFDLTPADIHLGYRATQNNQKIIKKIPEGSELNLRVNHYGNGWAITTPEGQEIGALSKKCTQFLQSKNIRPGYFQFLAEEVTVKYIYHHFKADEVTGEIIEDWFAIIPQIRICR